jgi:UDP-N-acetylmuramate dehydrogenase
MNWDRLAERLAAGSESKVERDRVLARLTTYRLGGPARVFVQPASKSDLELHARALSEAPDVPVLVLGRGSNLVISDRGFDGVVIHLGNTFGWIEEEPGAKVRAGGGAAMPQVANHAARRGLSGIEWMIAIPGSIGGGVRMNAGAHGGDMSKVLESALVWDLGRGLVSSWSLDEFGYSYRRSSLGDEHLVVEATLALEALDPAEVRSRMDAYRRHRSETQPPAAQNAGSVFKNPAGDSAGRLVETAGLKGFRVGGVSVSEIHANFFVAGTGATSQDVYDLVAEVRGQVMARSGIELEPEIRFVGLFEEHVEGSPT